MPDVPGLEQVVGELTDEVQQLKEHIAVLRIAIDDLRCEVEWGIRQIAAGAWLPTQNPPGNSHEPIKVVQKDPADEEQSNIYSDSEPAESSPAAGSVPRGLWD